jgi:AcrR family transcriptional regulator
MGTTERKKREKKQRASAILDAAEAVFFAKGFENSTMDDVATQAELSKGCVYNYFKNKNELCIGIVERGVKLAYHMIKAAVENCYGGTPELFQAAAEGFLEFSLQHPKYYCALQSYRHHRGGCGVDSSYLNLVIEDNSKVTKIFADMITQGQTNGTIRQDVEPKEIAAAIWGDFDGALPGFQLNSEKASGSYRRIVGLLVDGLKAH